MEKIAGTGLGMTITKNIVDMMNGDIRIESSPGKGSVFTVTFRLLKNEEKHSGLRTDLCPPKVPSL